MQPIQSIRQVQNGRFKWPMAMPTSADYRNKSAGYYKHQFNIIEDKVVEFKEIVVYEFHMGDVEDPDLFAAEHLYEWEHSEMGKWVKSHAVEVPIWHRQVSPGYMGWRYIIVAKLTGKDYTHWAIKWQKLNP